jgi:hypothetical protein
MVGERSGTRRLLGLGEASLSGDWRGLPSALSVRVSLIPPTLDL